MCMCEMIRLARYVHLRRHLTEFLIHTIHPISTLRLFTAAKVLDRRDVDHSIFTLIFKHQLIAVLEIETAYMRER